jgi:hypothetical protein
MPAVSRVLASRPLGLRHGDRVQVDDAEYAVVLMLQHGPGPYGGEKFPIWDTPGAEYRKTFFSSWLK